MEELINTTHTHTHTCSDTSTVDFNHDLQFQEFYMQPWTYTSQFLGMNMDFLCTIYHGLLPYP